MPGYFSEELDPANRGIATAQLLVDGGVFPHAAAAMDYLQVEPAERDRYVLALLHLQRVKNEEHRARIDEIRAKAQSHGRPPAPY